MQTNIDFEKEFDFLKFENSKKYTKSQIERLKKIKEKFKTTINEEFSKINSYQSILEYLIKDENIRKALPTSYGFAIKNITDLQERRKKGNQHFYHPEFISPENEPLTKLIYLESSNGELNWNEFIEKSHWPENFVNGTTTPKDYINLLFGILPIFIGTKKNDDDELEQKFHFLTSILEREIIRETIDETKLEYLEKEKIFKMWIKQTKEIKLTQRIGAIQLEKKNKYDKNEIPRYVRPYFALLNGLEKYK